MYICIYAYLQICIYIHVYIYINICIYTYIHIYICTYIHKYLNHYPIFYDDIHIYSCIYTYIHVYMHVYTYVHSSLQIVPYPKAIQLTFQNSQVQLCDAPEPRASTGPWWRTHDSHQQRRRSGMTNMSKETCIHMKRDVHICENNYYLPDDAHMTRTANTEGAQAWQICQKRRVYIWKEMYICENTCVSLRTHTCPALITKKALTYYKCIKRDVYI